MIRMNVSRLFGSALLSSCVLVSGLSAQMMGDPRGHGNNPDAAILASAYAQVLSDLSTTSTLGDIKMADLQKAMDELSVARQEYSYVKRSEAASFALPGIGQIRDGDPGIGALFLVGDVGLFAGALVGTYFLLPPDLQLDKLNYWTDSYSTIKAAWEGHSLKDYLPSFAVAASGAILSHVLRFAASSNAGSLARKNIQDKKVTFQPEPLMLFPGVGGQLRMAMGMRMLL